MNILLDACQWLNDLPPSIALSESEWAFALIESAHVLSIGLVAGTVALVDLRVLGLALGEVRLTQVAQRLLPVTRVGFVIMALTGALLFASEAARLYGNPLFRAKLVLLVLAGVNAWVFHATVYAHVGTWEDAPRIPAGARVAAISSLVLWAAIIIAGRLIAYYH